jgi:hypothetical protein
MYELQPANLRQLLTDRATMDGVSLFYYLCICVPMCCRENYGPKMTALRVQAFLELAVGKDRLAEARSIVPGADGATVRP